MKKNVYMVQADYLHGRSIFLPYAAGTLIANAMADPELCSFYDFKEPLFLREKTDDALEKIRNPFIVGFSNYIWNHEYNKVLARKIKNRYPECLIVFGGHQISTDTSLMDENRFIDIMCFGEGEETFAAILTAAKNGGGFDGIPNIALRKNGEPCITFFKKAEGTDYPSPYLTGVFDSILEKNPQYLFHAMIETNRGCPYGCTYCDWGNLHCGIKFFPEKKIMEELRWLSSRKIIGFGGADANFGMFERDERFVDEMVRLHNEEGVFRGFQVSYAKNSNDRVFRISKKLNDCGMDKGATLSFQSLSPVVLENINRKNISVDSFTALMNRYNEAGIPTYSELILGLPGETYDSFVEGIDILLNAGQHNSIYIHNCEWLPCSAMGSPEYMSRHGIKFALVPLSQTHTIINHNEEVREYSRLVVETNTMTRADWVRMNIYAATVQALHHGGLLMLLALYLHDKKGVKYSDFYNKFVDFMFANPESAGGRIYIRLKEKLEAVARGVEALVWEDSLFGEVGWASEEYLFLCIALEADKFYDEAEAFVKEFFGGDEAFADLWLYQRETLKLPFKETIEFESGYNFKSYFSDLLCGKPAELKKAKCTNRITATVKCKSWKDYAHAVVWYGKKDKRSIYLDEIEILI